MSGRPPLLVNDDESTRRRIVSFSADESPGEGLGKIFEDPHASGISMSARTMIKALLNNVAGKRPSMQELVIMDFFACNNVDGFSLSLSTASSSSRCRSSHASSGLAMVTTTTQFHLVATTRSKQYGSTVTTVVNTERSGELLNKAPIPEDDERTGSFTPIRSMAGSALPTLR